MQEETNLSPELTPAPTLGERRVRITFNPSEKESVTKLKRMCADIIDLLQALRNDIAVSPEAVDMDPASFQQQYGETLRLIADGQRYAEGAAMWGTKALTAA